MGCGTERPGTPNSVCCPSDAGKGVQALWLCRLWEVLIFFPLIEHTKSAHSSLREKEGFGPK